MATTEELKEQQFKQWTDNAPGWDGVHERLEREMSSVTDWLCREARLAPGMRVLDLACGSGHPALNAAKLVAPGGSVLATDMVPEMVSATRRRAGEARLDNFEARVMDAEAIDLPDASFDAVTCRFGVMFCAQPSVAVAGIHRVLKPGSRFALSVWSEPQNSPGQTVMGEAMRRYGREQPPVDFDAPGVFQLAPDGKLQRLLEAAGFHDVKVEKLPVTMEYESYDAFLQRQTVRPGPLRSLLETISSDEAQRLKGIVVEVLKPYTRDGVIRLTSTPLMASATK
ncbi:MAG TPA: methyltransferase domain-containing protein [Dehalococcoidia bacterium]|nr:methyltransferase domain-containing protein [Dehalococcoidia bacterium]